MKRKIMLAFLLSLLIILAACTGGEETNLDSKNPVTLDLWHYYAGDNKIALEKAVEEFNNTLGSEKGVIVNAVAKGLVLELEKDITDSANGAINAEAMPDLFSCYPDKAMDIDELGKLCDLNQYFTEAEKKAYVEEFLNDGQFKGERLLILPIVKSTELLYINETAWNEFASAKQIDQKNLSTWEGIYATAQAYYQWSDGKSLMGFDSVANYIIIGNRQLGVEIIDGKNEQVVIDRAVMKKIFESYYQGMSLGYFNAIGKFRSDDIKAGDLVAYVGSSSGAAYFPNWIERDNTQVPIDLLALSYPVFEGGKPFAVAQGAGMCISNTSPKKQEGAAFFLKWFTAKQQNIEFAMTTGYLPVQASAYKDSKFKELVNAIDVTEVSRKNIAEVYDIALNQILLRSTYASLPFKGSYEVRTILEKALIDMGEAGREEAEKLKKQGLTDEQIIEVLNSEKQFELYLDSLYSQFEQLGIAYHQID